MRRRVLAAMFFADAISLAIGMGVASYWVFGEVLPWVSFHGSDVFPMMAILAGGMALGSWLTKRAWGRGVPRPSYGRGVAIAAITVSTTALALVFLRTVYYSRPFILIAVGTGFLIGLGVRAYTRSRPWTEAMLVISGEKGLVDDLMLAPHTNVLGIVDPQTHMPPPPPARDVTIVLDLRALLSEEVAQFVSSSNLAGLRLRPLVDVYEEHTGRMAIVHLAEGWELRMPVEASSYLLVKRGVDLILVALAAPIALVLSLLLWPLIRMDSKGPAVFKQVRVGRGEKLFTAYKFRTMKLGSDQNGAQMAQIDDPRLTRVGRVVRKFRLDELPQLWNVAKGDMSLVGPRPEQPSFVEQFEAAIPFYGHRHLIRPGVTGWAQVHYGYADSEADTIEKLTYDLYYVKHMSPWVDLHVLGKSVWTVLSGFGAR